MKLQNLTIIFIIIILPIVLVLSAYIGYEVKTINKQNMYNTGVNTAVHDAVFAYEMNSKNDDYSDNAENKRSNIKASVKTFENSLSNACNLGLYNNDAIEEYIPALVFGMYDGFYMYAPSETKNGYKHNLRNFVYYSEEISCSNYDLIIRYTLDNYVAVSGTIDGTYITKAGYLINLDKCNNYNWKKTKSPDDKIEEATLLDNFTYEGVSINEKEELIYTTLSEDKTELISNSSEPEKDSTAIEYYKEAIAFSEWFNEYIISKNVSSEYGYLSIKDGNDPEKEDSKFVQHKNQIIKEKMENVLNSSITAYANKTRNSYKMPKFNEEEWKKIYNNISIVALVQGMNLGFKTYNNYCIVSSTNNNEYVNPNLLYFTDGNSYHDIRCTEIAEDETTGYRIGDFEKKSYEEVQKDEEGNELKDATGTVITKDKYYYKHNELACYKCVNGSIESTKSIYDYVRDNEVNSKVRSSYFTSLARERYKTTKLLSSYNDVDARYYTITYKYTNMDGAHEEKVISNIKKGNYVTILNGEDVMLGENETFMGWKVDNNEENILEANKEYQVISNITLTPYYKKIYKIEFYVKNERINIWRKVDTESVTEGSKFLINKEPTTNSKYRFLKWNTQKDGSGEDYHKGTTITVNSNIKLYAMLQEQVTIDIIYAKTNYDEIEKRIIMIDKGTKLSEPEKIKIEHYNFQGWYADKEYNKEFDFNQEINSNTKIYAKYKSEFSLEWKQDSNGKIYFVSSIDITELQFKSNIISIPTVKYNDEDRSWYFNDSLKDLMWIFSIVDASESQTVTKYSYFTCKYNGNTYRADCKKDSNGNVIISDLYLINN